MSNTKTVMGQASNQYVVPTDITDVFSTYLYEGNGSTQTITNGIDLDGEGGLVWSKSRSGAYSHGLYDTERGVTKEIKTDATTAESTDNGVTAFNSDGYDVGARFTTNNNGDTYASWTFRKAPKFFDVVTYTGDGVAGREIAHNLGTTVGTIIVKRVSNTSDWTTWHRSLANNEIIALNLASEAYIDSAFFATPPSTTVFTVGNTPSANASGETYVAYLFAHNDGDGEFGPDGDQDIIKCGSYTGNGSSDGPEIDLGFEPQWLLIKNASTSVGNWNIADVMRGMPVGSNTQLLAANTSGAEGGIPAFVPQPTGFKVVDSNEFSNGSGNTYIYIAIRRGPLAPPESATEVFDITTHNATVAPAFKSDFPVDFALINNVTAATAFAAASRLTQGKSLTTASTASETSDASYLFDYQDGWRNTTGTFSNLYSWMWKRAPNFFDVVAYTGNNSTSRSISHNLGVAPEMIWVKRRDGTYNWLAWHSVFLGTGLNLYLDTNNSQDNGGRFSASGHTSEVFNLGATIGGVNTSGEDYIAYLFASLDGVSKVFSVTKSSGSDASVNCGFSSGPRFVMLKRTDSTGDWYVWDTERGIVAGNDPYLLLNSTAAEVTSTDYIDPTSNGFTIVNGGLADGDYIGYAVA